MTNSVRSCALLLPAMVALSGCSDQSRYVMNITRINPAASEQTDSGSLQSDIVGNHTLLPCRAWQDIATITVRVEHPGSIDIGPKLGAWITGYRVEYFYYDPLTGQLAGPISFLTSTSTNLRIPAGVHGSGVMTVTFDMPISTFGLKAWCVGATYNNNAGYGNAVVGSIWVERVVARVTVTGEDSTGKKLSADGSLLIYLNNYGPGPTDPAGNPSDGTWCFGIDMWTYWSNFGGVQP